MNPYLYCSGDPVNAVDPSGMMHVAGGGGGYWRVDSVYSAHEGVSASVGRVTVVGIDNGRVIERSRMTPSYYRDPLSGERCSTLSASLGMQAGWESNRVFTVQESLTGIGIGENPWPGIYLWRGMGHVSSGWNGPSGYAVSGIGYEVSPSGSAQEIFGTPNAGVNFFNYLW